MLRKLSRALRIGSTFQKLHSWNAVGAVQLLKIAQAKRNLLPRITEAAPLRADHGLEVHMLLHHRRIYDGCWGLYSFAHFAEVPCRIVIHDDGSLTTEDKALLKKTFIGIRIISRQEADAKVRTEFSARGLPLCDKFRQNLIFGLKLFDPFFYLEGDSFVLLDSDVLTFRRPKEVLNATHPVYSVDNGTHYSLPDEELKRLLGQSCLNAFNPGVVRAARETLDLQKIETFLAHPGFWREGKPDYYAELTIWAMLLTLQNAQPLPKGYAICPNDPYDSKWVTGHYCGQGYWASLLYTEGIPYLRATLLRPQDTRKVSS